MTHVTCRLTANLPRTDISSGTLRSGFEYGPPSHFCGVVNSQTHDCAFRVISARCRRVKRETYSPPNSCMPSSAKIRMKRKSRNSSDMMERMLLSSDITRLRRDGQYLYRPQRHHCQSVRREKSQILAKYHNKTSAKITALIRPGGVETICPCRWQFDGRSIYALPSTTNFASLNVFRNSIEKVDFSSFSCL